MTDLLTTRFGPVKELEIVRSKACAFLEFETADAARRAILASLPVAQGGEGGIRITDGEANHGRDNAPRITVEPRKDRADRIPSRPRGGGPNGEMRGGFRGGPRGGGASRGTRGVAK